MNKQKEWFEEAYRKNLDIWSRLESRDEYLEKALCDYSREHKGERRFLDIGCGNGRHCLLAEKAGFESHGIDYSEKAKELAERNGVKNILVADISEGLPFPAGSLDMIIDFGCFHHLDKKHWKEYAEEVRRVLKPEGVYLISTFSKKTEFAYGFSPADSAEKCNITEEGLLNHFLEVEDIPKIFPGFNVLELFEKKLPINTELMKNAYIILAKMKLEA